MDETHTVHCHACGRQLNESTELKFEERQPCPDCGSKARLIKLQLGATVTTTGEVITDEQGNVTVYAPSAVAIAEPHPGLPRAIEAYVAGDFHRKLVWSKTPGGLSMCLVYNERDEIVGVSVHESADDVLLVLAEDILPPE